MRRRWGALGAAVALLAGPAMALVLAAPPAGALTTINVTTPTELYSAITTANGTADDVLINLAPGTYALGSGPLVYTGGVGGAHTLTVEGNGATIDQQTAGAEVFHSTSANAISLTLDHLTIEGGSAPASGGAVFAASGLTITNSTVTNNSGAFDILDSTGATTTLTNDTVSNNVVTATVTCEGIVDTDTTVATNSQFTANTCTGGTGSADGVFNTTGTTITSSSFVGNHNTAKGTAQGIVFPTNLTMSGTVMENNTNTTTGGAAEGMINAEATTITGSSIVGNTNSASRGAAQGMVFPTTLTFTDSTVASNTNSAGTGTADGGGIDGPGDDLTVVNSTVADNATSGATTKGGGIFQDPPGAASQTAGDAKHPAKGGVGAAADPTTTLVYATIVGNTAATGANLDVGQIVPFGSVVALPQGGANCVASTTTASQGFNFSDDGSCGFTASTDHPNGGSPVLGALANNGGPGPTLLPLAGSPLLDGVAAGSCQADGAAGITTDERGLPRPDSASPACDIGAVEVQPPSVIVAAFTG
jgi:hypothetical protein